jgi:hypothetical protein
VAPPDDLTAAAICGDRVGGLWYRRHPEIEDVAIVAPLIGLGLPRTGSTALSFLLAQDPNIRYLRQWIDFASGVDSNGAALRWAWVMRNGDEVVLEGIDFAELAPDGRIQRIAGFFGPFPPLDD